MRADLTYCDFLVLAPLDFEVGALTDALLGAGWTLTHVRTPDFPSLSEWTITDTAAARSVRHAVVVQLNHQGVLNASVDTARALDLYEPGYVVSFGIAGSLTADDAPLGSVVFATDLIYYEPSKDESDVTKSRMAPVPVGDGLRNPFRVLDVSGIMRVPGPVASGEKLFADINSQDRQRILATNDKTLAVEMEAAGVGRAVHRLCPAAEYVVIKGISDLADKEKNSASKKVRRERRATAAAHAAACLVKLMKGAPLRRAWRSIPPAHEALLPQTAARETQLILDTLKPYGIRVDPSQLYGCLYGRRGPIPAYYHWRQHSAALHWVDFKILAALRALPSDIVTPTPIATVTDEFAAAEPWQRCVRSLVGVAAITDRDLKAQQEELSTYIRNVGWVHADNRRRHQAGTRTASA